MQPDQFRVFRKRLVQFGQGLGQQQGIVAPHQRLLRRLGPLIGDLPDQLGIQGPDFPPASLLSLVPPELCHPATFHLQGQHSEEVPMVLPVHPGLCHQPLKRIVHQHCRLDHRPWPVPPEQPVGNRPGIGLDGPIQPILRLPISLSRRTQEARDVVVWHRSLA